MKLYTDSVATTNLSAIQQLTTMLQTVEHAVRVCVTCTNTDSTAPHQKC